MAKTTLRGHAARLALLAASATNALAAEDWPYHHVAVVIGKGVEEKTDHDENIDLIGIDYEYRFSDRLSAGGVLEFVGNRDDTIRNHVAVAALSVHLAPRVRVFLGPGYEWNDKSDKWLVRAGAGYSFALGGNWSIAPEAFIDFIATGDRTYGLGLAIGYHFGSH